MKNSSLIQGCNTSFEDTKKTNQYGIEYWSARDLQNLLGYSQWRRFENAIERAVESCKQSGNNPNDHFAGAGKMVEIGSKTGRDVEDWHLSRFACYLIAQNGDPRKPEIAHAQKYFAIQTRRQELSDAMAADLERLESRKQASEEFKALSGAAREAGVQNKMFGMFHDAGYKGLYGGLGVDAIKARKGISSKEQLMDRMGTTELIANQFRMSQTREKLKRENIQNQRDAMETHEMVGKKVRSVIEEIGGTLPENIPPAEPIKNVEKRLKKTKPVLLLADNESAGLVPKKSKIK
ncbi:MAG: DNA damage-inducible protein D [Chlamydiae bacterium]|nr:DNA damage-inducible protein D [Chlamydiota bacterium]